jgi:hypothetical protein
VKAKQKAEKERCRNAAEGEAGLSNEPRAAAKDFSFLKK